MFTQESLSLSTMWNYAKAQSGEELVEQILALGFSQVELNYQVKSEWLPAIEKAVSSGYIRISSIHNVFPKTYDSRFDTDSVLLGYEDSSLRNEAITLCKRGIDWACRLGASAVVIHPTEVPLDPNKYDRPLKMMIAQQQTATQAFMDLQAQFIKARKASPYIHRMLQSIETLASYVVSKKIDVRLGMENRSMGHQIPIFSEFDIIANVFDVHSPVGIWLDTGHAIMMQELGLQQLPLSKQVADNLVGMHIHDAANGRDHFAPYSLEGDVLAPYIPYILKSPIKVLELSGRLTSNEILSGSTRLLEHLNKTIC